MKRRWKAVLSHERQPQILYSGLVCVLERSPDQWTSVVDESGYSDCGREATDANARLISAAPELLDALKAVVEIYGPWHDDDCPGDDTCECSAKPLHDAINGAVRKAEGRQ